MVDGAGARLSSRLFGRLLAGYAVALGCVQVLTIGLSMVGATIDQALSVGVLGLSAVVGVLAAWWWPHDSVATESPDGRAMHGGSGRVAQAILGMILVLAYALLWWIAVLSFDLTCDGNAYHLPPISLWWRAGRIHWIDPRIQLEPLMNGYPKGVELVGYVLSRSLNTSSVANALNLIYLPLGVLGLGYLTRRLGGAGWAALLAGLLYLLVPVTVWQAQTAYLDSAYASCVIALAAAVVRVERVWAGVPERGVQWGLPLGAVAGLALGAKGSAGVTVVVAFGLLGIAALQTVCRAKNDRWRTLTRVAGLLIVAALVALAVGGYWYVRNWLRTGTPLYPVGITIGGRVLFPGVSVSQALWEEGNTPALFQPWPEWRRIGYTWLQGLDDWPRTVFAVDGRLGGLGYVWILGGLPAALWLLVEALIKRRPHRRAWIFLFVLVGLSFVATPMRWWARYTLWLHALGLPALGVALSRLTYGRGLVRLGLVWGLAVLAVAGWEGWLCGRAMVRSVYPGRWPPTAGAFVRPESWWRPHTYLYPEVAGTVLSEILQSDVPVAVGHMWTISPSGRWKHNLLGALTLPLGHRDLMPLPNEITPDHLIPLREEMRARNVRYIILDDQEPVPVVLHYLAVEEIAVPGFLVLTLPES